MILRILGSLPHQLPGLARLPYAVKWFYLRAVAGALWRREWSSVVAGTLPRELMALLRIASGRQRIVEIGTASGWTTIALALADPRRRVTSYDRRARPERDRYLQLVGADVRSRIELVERRGVRPLEHHHRMDLVYLDGSHTREGTMKTFLAWRDRVQPGGLIVFHDHADETWPGVDTAIRELDIEGESQGHLFVWHRPGGES